MAITNEPVRFDSGDTAEVLARMRVVATDRSGARWMNLIPHLGVHEVPDGPGVLGAAFSARGPSVPEATWVPATSGRRRQRPASIGISHGTGKGAVDRIREAGIVVADEWVVRQDHPKRGLVMELHERNDPESILGFFVRALPVLSQVPLNDRWLAVFASRR